MVVEKKLKGREGGNEKKHKLAQRKFEGPKGGGGV